MKKLPFFRRGLPTEQRTCIKYIREFFRIKGCDSLEGAGGLDVVLDVALPAGCDSLEGAGGLDVVLDVALPAGCDSLEGAGGLDLALLGGAPDMVPRI
ncbi:unnamed protein product [Boreogadus saida]